ncbi:MAG: hypothetical protein ACI9EF_003907 [Pseudohongiellaceae bacterium]|jgi:hypothetical protein
MMRPKGLGRQGTRVLAAPAISTGKHTRSDINQRLILISIVLILNCCSTQQLRTPDSDGDQDRGRLRLHVSEAQTGQPLPCKLLFFQHGRPYDLQLSSSATTAVRGHTLYTLAGEVTVDLPAGAYEVLAGRGSEYSLARGQVQILEGRDTELKLTIQRCVDTRGFVSGDMHLHTLTHSGHGDSNMEERVISCLGEGLEWAVATDHNHVTDYAPLTESYNAQGWMSTSSGNEVSTSFGHFNAYPLDSSSAPVELDPSDAVRQFRLIRAGQEAVVVQINHPREGGIDYFTLKGLDEHLAQSSDPQWSWDFDALEVLNGNSANGWFARGRNPISVKQDWFNMLNSGRRITAVGNSDSHTVESMLAGVPRNYIASPVDDPALIDEQLLAENIRLGRVSVSAGLFVQLWVDGMQCRNDKTLQGDTVEVRIRVQGPEWVDCDKVTLVGNGEVLRTFEVSGSPPSFDETFTVQLSRDTWLIAIADGSQPMAPMIHDAPDPVLPLAFTNPVWVDANSDGRFQSLAELALNHDDPRGPMFPFALAQQLQEGPRQAVEFMAQRFPELGRRNRLFAVEQLQKLASPAAAELLQGLAERAVEPLLKLALADERNSPLSAGQIDKISLRLLAEESQLEETYWSRYAQSVPFLIESEASHRVLINGEECLDRPQGTPGAFASALVMIPMEVGKNVVSVLFADHGAPADFVCEPVDADKWLHPAIASKVRQQHLAFGLPPSLTWAFAEKYSGGRQGLTDGWRGSNTYQDGFWVGFEQVDMSAELSWQTPQTVSSVSAGFLQDHGSWIWLPQQLEVWGSSNGVDFERLGRWENTTSARQASPFRREATVEFAPTSVRQIKVVAKSLGSCPPWHKGAGGKAWIFCDELVVE